MCSSDLRKASQEVEAIELTFDLLGRFPELAGFKINHALALVQNNRTPDARALLDTVDPRQLAPSEATAYYLASFEAHLNQQRYGLAWQCSDHIEGRYLLPTEVQWLEQSRQKLPPRLKPQL